MVTKSEQNTRKLEKVAINDELLLKAAQSDAIANLKSFSVPGTQRLNFDGFIYTHYAALRHFAGIVIIASVDGGWVKVRSYCFGIPHSSVDLKTVPK